MFHLEEIASPELEAKYSSAASLVQVLSDRFFPLEQDYSSYKIYAHEADCTSARALDEDVRIAIEHTLQLLSSTEYMEETESLQRFVLDGQDVWQKWQALISLLSELAVSERYCFILLIFYLYVICSCSELLLLLFLR